MSSDAVRLMQSLMGLSGHSWQATQWSPPVDVYRLADGWLVKFDIAGVRPTDIKLVVHGRRLTLSGRRRDWIVEEIGPYSAYSMEITYSHFERTIELPCEIEHLHIASDYRDGMLLVRLNEEGCAK